MTFMADRSKRESDLSSIVEEGEVFTLAQTFTDSPEMNELMGGSADERLQKWVAGVGEDSVRTVTRGSVTYAYLKKGDNVR